MKGRLIAVFCFALLLICSNLKAWNTTKTKTDTPAKTNSLIVVRFALKKGTSSDFQYFDKFGGFKRFVALKMSKDTVFQKKFTSTIPLELYSTYGRKILFFLFPGDTLTITVDGQSVRASSRITTAIEANFFTAANFPQKSIFDYESQFYLIKLPERLPLLELLYSKSVELLKHKKDSLSPEVYSLLSAAVDYEYLHFKLLRLWVDSSGHLPKLKDSINTIIREEKRHYLNEFTKMLQLYNKVRWGRDFDNPDYFKRMYDSSYCYYSGAVRDRMLLLQLTGIRNRTPVYLNEYLFRFYQDCNDLEYKEYAKNNFVSTGNSNAKELRSNGSERKSWDDLLQSYKGKVIYIDFWASWCMPCRSEMPGARDLIKAYDNNAFAYVFISIDDLLTDWKEASGEENIISYKYNYLLSNSGDSQIGKLLQLSSIPRHVLINKQGVIVDLNAPGAAEMMKNKTIDNLISERQIKVH